MPAPSTLTHAHAHTGQNPQHMLHLFKQPRSETLADAQGVWLTGRAFATMPLWWGCRLLLYERQTSTLLSKCGQFRFQKQKKNKMVKGRRNPLRAQLQLFTNLCVTSETSGMIYGMTYRDNLLHFQFNNIWC